MMQPALRGGYPLALWGWAALLASGREGSAGGRADASGLGGARRMPSNGTFFSPRYDIPIPRRRYHLLSSTRSDGRPPVPILILLSPEEDFRSLFAHGCSVGHNTGTSECRGILTSRSRTRWKSQRYCKLKFCGDIYCNNNGRADANAFTVLSSFVDRWRSLLPSFHRFATPSTFPFPRKQSEIKRMLLHTRSARVINVYSSVTKGGACKALVLGQDTLSMVYKKHLIRNIVQIVGKLRN